MAATVQIFSFHEATPSGADVTDGTIRFKQADDDTQDANAPIPIPAAGYEYSYLKQLQLKASTSPTGTIDNIKFFGDGSLDWAGCAIYAEVRASYIDPTTQVDTAHPSWVDNWENYVTGAPLSVAGSIDNPDTGYFGELVVQQLRVGDAAGVGVQAAEDVTFRYDET